MTGKELKNIIKSIEDIKTNLNIDINEEQYSIKKSYDTELINPFDVINKDESYKQESAEKLITIYIINYLHSIKLNLKNFHSINNKIEKIIETLKINYIIENKSADIIEDILNEIETIIDNFYIYTGKNDDQDINFNEIYHNLYIPQWFNKEHFEMFMKKKLTEKEFQNIKETILNEYDVENDISVIIENILLGIKESMK